MTDVVKALDEALAGWTRAERTIPDYPHLTETMWTRDEDRVRHVGGMGTDEIKGRPRTQVCLISAEISGRTHYLPGIDPVLVLLPLIGGSHGS